MTDRCCACHALLEPRAAVCGTCGELAASGPPPHPAEALDGAPAVAATSPAMRASSRPDPAQPALLDLPPEPRAARPPASAAFPESLDAYRRRLRDTFGFPDFRGGQARVLERLAHGDVLAVMPTGSGKSLCYVLPALEVGRTLVVSPLIALMQDQVEGLHVAGVAATFINSNLSRDEQNRRYRAFVEGRADLLFVAPERFALPAFTEGLRAAGVSLLAIDEAHCISEWGHNFRPDYLQLGAIRERLGAPRTLALTATANPQVRADIVQRLGIADRATEVVTTVDRPNLSFAVHHIPDERSRIGWLRSFVRPHAGSSGIVYARTRKLTEELAATLSASGFRAEAYHAGMDRQRRARVQRAFTTGEIPLIVATIAFGMGIDKPDVRYVVHFNLPGRLEAYYQEAGRAGRDGDPAECVLLHGPRDESSQHFFIRQAHPDDEAVRGRWRRWLGALDRAGRIPLDEVEEDAGAAMTIAALRASGLLEDVELRVRSRDPNARIDTSAIRRHQRHAYDRLDEMLEYAATDGCRRAVILRYFGEDAPDRCEGCDNCLRPPDRQRTSLALAAPTRRRGPRERGRRPRTPAEAPTRERPLPGTRDRPPREPMEVSRAEDRSGLLAALRKWRRSRANTEGIPAFRVASDHALEQIAIMLPDTVVALRTQVRMDADQIQRYGDDVIEVVRQHRARVAPSGSIQDDPLYAALRAWRLERARSDGVPAYTVFSDRTLRELVAVRPRNVHALLRIWGLGEARVDRFGPELVGVIREQEVTRG